LARPFLDRIGWRDDDSVPRFERAARRNYSDAEALRRADRRFGPVYLYGYSVEMTIKAAYFRAIFKARVQPITTPIGSTLRNQEWSLRANLNLPPRPSNDQENQHDILIWSLLLAWRRSVLGNQYQYPPWLAQELVNRAADVYKYWREYMRYRSVAISASELGAIRSHAKWFRNQYLDRLHPL
jgi:hypothetical protein